MARPESQQIAGYFATPEHLLPHIASLVSWPLKPREDTYLLDPCAGEGTAILALRELWRVQAGIPAEGRWGGLPDNLPAVYAAELEAGRAETLRDRLLYGDQLFAGDALTLSPFPKSSARATVLFLNPPYDFEATMGRLEHRFLDHFTAFLHPGAGALLFVVPAAGLAASAGCLARHYLDLQAFRFPDPDYAAFGQIVVVGRRARVSGPPLFEETIRSWAAEPERLPILAEHCASPLPLDLDSNTFSLAFESCPLDVQAAQAAFRPWLAAPVGQDGPVLDLFGATLDAAFPPKPTHLALALSVGLFNGHHLEANDPVRHPPIVAKGVLDRELLTIGERRNSDGDVTATVELETPSLSLSALDLEQGVFHALAHGVVPTDDADLANWNAADLLTHYDRSLTARLTAQIRPLHDPRDAARRIALPDLARKPFAIQREAIEAAIKLLAAGRNPFLLAEVGTGKSTMALSIAAALTPAHRAQTLAELRRAGYAADRLPLVRRLLIVCPPHLLSTWQEEAAAVLPEARVHILRKPGDLAVDADVCVMSREDAKLGHPWIGTPGPCPRCGTPVHETAEERAERRLTCTASLRRPANDSALLALHLATILAPVRGRNPIVARLAPARVLAHYRDRDEERALSPAHLAAFFDRALAVFLAHLGDAWTDESVMPPLANHLNVVARQADRGDVLSAALNHRAETEDDATALSNLSMAQPRSSSWASPDRGAEDLIRLLELLEERALWNDDRPCGEFLFQAEASPRRVPLARFLRRYHPRRFDLLVLDEAHEFGNADSAQSKAALRLTTLPGIATIVLSGSLMGGYASSLFPLFWALSAKMREQFLRSDVAAFSARYGYRKLLLKSKDRETRRGRMSDREVGRPTVLGEAPGILPTFLLQHLLPTSIIVHKSELDAELPPIAEVPVLLRPETETDHELLDAYREMAAELVDRIKSARRSGASGRFLGALSELPSFLDRATDDLPPFLLRDPLSGEAIAPPPVFSAAWRTPKERWLLETVAKHVAAGERVLIYLRHTGGGELPGRLLRILSDVAPKAAFLDCQEGPRRLPEGLDRSAGAGQGCPRAAGASQRRPHRPQQPGRLHGRGLVRAGRFGHDLPPGERPIAPHRSDPARDDLYPLLRKDHATDPARSARPKGRGFASGGRPRSASRARGGGCRRRQRSIRRTGLRHGHGTGDLERHGALGTWKLQAPAETETAQAPASCCPRPR